MDQLVDPLRLSGIAWAIWFAYWMVAARELKEAKWSEGWLGRVQHLGPIGFAMYFFFRQPAFFGGRVLPAVFGWTGFALVLLGLGFTVWARRHLGGYWSGKITLKVGHKVIKTGPYAKVRHPIYTGIVLASVGLSVAQGGWAGVAGLALMIFACTVKLKREEKLLREQFGGEYETYRKHTWGLMPGVW
jgi:protein-S-isoprenylcysteine O-methyltransferase Ste14